MIMVTAANLVAIKLDSAMRQKLLERAREVVFVDWFGTKVAARFNQPNEADAFRRRYRSFLSNGRPDFVSCAVASDDEEPLFFTEPGDAFRYPLVLRKGGVVAFLADAVTCAGFFGIHPALLSFHAAAVSVGNSAVAISAISTGGKSTTAFACARRGMGLYTDERCVLKNGFVHPFPRAMNIRAGGIELLLSERVPDEVIAQPLRAHAGKDWECAQFSEVLGAQPLPKPAKLESIFFITGRSRTPRAEQMELQDALQRLLASSFSGAAPGMDRLAAAAGLLQQARPYALTLGTPDDTALLIAATVRREKPMFAVAGP